MTARRRWRAGATLAALSCLLGGWLLVGMGAAAAQTTYVAFGDSITDGVGDGGPNGGPASGYPVRLQNLLTDALVRNRGLSGERTTEGITRIDQVLAEGGDILLLMEGTNDVSRRIPLETTLFNLSEMARKAGLQGMPTVHATVIPRRPDAKVDFDNVVNRQLNRSIRDLAGRAGRRLVDNFEIYSELPRLFRTYYWDSDTDPVGHPNAAGYDVIAQTFADVLQNFDQTPPVPGLTTPAYRDSLVPGDTQLVVDVWDFGAGIDQAATRLLVDGGDSGAAPVGGSRAATFTITPSAPWSGLVRVRLEATDLASPPNTFDREIVLFTGEDTPFLDGDFDLDGTVDSTDVNRFVAAFGTRRGDAAWDPFADINADGVVDGFDLALIAHSFGRSI